MNPLVIKIYAMKMVDDALTSDAAVMTTLMSMSISINMTLFVSLTSHKKNIQIASN